MALPHKNTMPRLLFPLFFVFALCVFGETTPAELTLAAESEAQCLATVNDPITPQQIMQKVDRACQLLKTEGATAFPKFKGKDSEFIFSGTYLWINSGDGYILMHPIRPNLEGKSLMGFSDVRGKLFFSELTNLVLQKGSGWVDYWWPKPGEVSPSYKVSYAKGVFVDGHLWVVGCGAYGFTKEQGIALKRGNFVQE